MRDYWDVTIISVFKDSDRPFFDEPSATVEYLIDRRGGRSRLERGMAPHSLDVELLADAPSAVVPDEWEPAFSALSDLAIAGWFAGHDYDVVMTTTPPLLALAIQLVPEHVLVIGQEHRATESRGRDLAPLLQFGARADALVLLGKRSATWLSEELSGSGVDIRVVSNAVPRASLRPRSTLTSPLIVSAGRMVAGKQFTHLIRAFHRVHASHPDWRLRIFGDGPERPRLVRLIGSLGLSGYVELPGTVGMLEHEWPKASLFALTSRAEGQGLVMLEAAAAGLPLVAYDCVGGVSDIIGENERGLLVPLGDVDALAAALLRFVESSTLRQEFGSRACLAMTSYEPAIVAKQWNELVMEVRNKVSNAGATRLERAAHRAALTEQPLRRALGADAVVTPTPLPILVPGTSRLRTRSAVLETVTAALASSKVPFVELPSHPATCTRVAVPREQGQSAIASLLQGPSASSMRVRPLAVMEGSLAEMGLETAPPALLLSGPGMRVFWHTSDGSGIRVFGAETGCDIEWWSLDDSGALVAPRPNEVVDELSPEDLVESPGSAPHSLQSTYGPFWNAVQFPIDAVYTWVDGSDPLWQERRKQYEPVEALHEASAGDHRYTDRHELRYSLRALAEFAPWIRHIYVITDGQRPNWLVDDDRLTVVDHRQIFAADGALPTFNSHAIETRLDRIEGLAEHFLYLNDDVFLGVPLAPDDFFTAGGATKFFPSVTKINWRESDEPHLQAARNVRNLLSKDFGVAITSGVLHTPIALRRSIMEELRDRYAPQFERTSRSRFRSPGDIAPVSSLFPFYAFLTGRAVPSPLRYRYANLGAADLPQRLTRILRERSADIFCIGDGDGEDRRPEETELLLGSFLHSYFPIPSRWER